MIARSSTTAFLLNFVCQMSPAVSRGGGGTADPPWNSEHIDQLPAEVRSAISHLCGPSLIFGIDSSDHQSDGGAERSLIPRICNMAVVWTLNVSDAGTRRASSIEDGIWDGLRMSVSATVGRTLTLGQSQRSLQRVRTRGVWA